MSCWIMRLSAAGVLAAFVVVASFANAETINHRSGEMSSIKSETPAPTMDSDVKANAFREVLGKMAAGEKIDPALWRQFVGAQNDAPRSGPEIGQKVPDFSLPDQNGRNWPLSELMGPRGLLLVFVRSADW
ncbi:MAG: hypothetical protein ACREQ4_16935 [Candidatus Binataceae bacterium]